MAIRNFRVLGDLIAALLLLLVSGHLKLAAAATVWYRLYGIAEDCAILYEMNELYRQQSEREIGDLPVLLWAIAGVFTMILIHVLVAMLSIGYGYSLFHSIGIPTFDKLIAPNKFIKKTSVFLCNLCSLYYSAYMCLHVHLT